MTKISVPTSSPSVGADQDEPFTVCPHFHQAVELIGARWSGAILRAMFLGCRRFGQIRSAVPGVSDTMLTLRLRELERSGVLRRVVHPTSPVVVEYLLTDKGRDLGPALEALVGWSHRWGGPPVGQDRP